jgi:hypothetical protein
MSRYYAGSFYEAADNGKEAARIVRNRPRVKHDQKDAILELSEISHADYDLGTLETRANPYFHATNAYEQGLHWDAIADSVFSEIDDADIRTWYETKNHARYLKKRKRLCHARGFRDDTASPFLPSRIEDIAGLELYVRGAYQPRTRVRLPLRGG